MGIPGGRVLSRVHRAFGGVGRGINPSTHNDGFAVDNDVQRDFDDTEGSSGYKMEVSEVVGVQVNVVGVAAMPLHTTWYSRSALLPSSYGHIE